MAGNSSIEWTDHTFNPWIGCTKVSPGCDNCYAERREDKRLHRVRWGASQPRQRTKTWGDPVRWNTQKFCECMACGWRGEDRATVVVDNPPGFHPPVTLARGCPACREPMFKETRQRVFCASLADVFDNEVQPLWRVELLTLIGVTEHLDWLLLTKRVGNVKRLLCEAAELAHERGLPATAHWIKSWVDGEPRPNVWLGATVVDQAEADRDIPKLLATPAAVRFLSIEPMLGPVDLSRIPMRDTCASECCGNWRLDVLKGASYCGEADRDPRDESDEAESRLDWVIAGGESGPGARPAHPDWFRSLRDQCAAAGVPQMFKQWGEWLPINQQDEAFTERLYRSNRKAALHEDQGALDESYGRTCTVPHGVVHLDGSFHEPLKPMAFMAGTGAMTTFKVGKRAAGRLLDGVTHDAAPCAARGVEP